MRIPTPSAHQLGAASICSALLLATFSATAEAACLAGRCSQNGLVFSQASSSFDITNVTGTGTQADPFVVYQDIRGLDISLAISGLKNTRQLSIFNRPGFAISIVSRNLTGSFWRFYDHELQETVGQTSGENDGLSFAQGIGPIRPYSSSHYEQADEVTDVRDFINFYRGDGVKPGETVRFDYYITDTIPNQEFYLRQRPDFRTNTLPTAVIERLLRPINQPEPAVPPQPNTIPTNTNQPPKPTPPHGDTPIEVSGKQSQSVPEPSTVAMGFLAILLGKWTQRNKRIGVTKR